MVNIFGRSFIGKTKKPTDVDLSKYATKEEVDDLLNLADVGPEEVAVFQDKQGKLKTSNIKSTDIVRKILGATQGNFVSFFSDGNIRDSSISIKDINDNTEKSVSNRLKTTGGSMTGELSLGKNKITVLRNPTSAEDAANKQYVDAGDTTVDNKLSTLRTEYEAHVTQFVRLRRNYQKTDEAVERFFGTPVTFDMKYAEIKTSLSEINTRLGVVRDSKSFSDLIAGLQILIGTIDKRLKDAEAGVPQITAKFNLLKISAGVDPENIVNVSYVVSAGNATWSQQNN